MGPRIAKSSNVRDQNLDNMLPGTAMGGRSIVNLGMMPACNRTMRCLVTNDSAGKRAVNFDGSGNVSDTGNTEPIFSARETQPIHQRSNGVGHASVVKHETNKVRFTGNIMNSGLGGN